MAAQSSSTSVGVGSLNEATIVAIIEITRNPEIWKYYDLMKLSNGSMKAHCKHCHKKVLNGLGFNQTSTNEFERYIGTDWINAMEQEEFESFDILSWWKGRQYQFPVLSIMARDLLSVQASTVASEFAFSLSGRTHKRIQHISNFEGDCLEIEQQLLDVEAEAGYTISLSDEEIVLDEQARSGSRDSE
nr:zinc finger BED domain-containing protein RICESLEEPER 2-like [Tanacetum cinerariifolium]